MAVVMAAVMTVVAHMAEKPSGERCGGPAQLARTCQSGLCGPSKNQGARAVIPYIYIYMFLQRFTYLQTVYAQPT